MCVALATHHITGRTGGVAWDMSPVPRPAASASKVLLSGEHILSEAAAAGAAAGAGGAIAHSQPRHHTRLLVLSHPPLKKVGLALQADLLHPVEGVDGVVQLAIAQRHQQPAVGGGVRQCNG